MKQIDNSPDGLYKQFIELANNDSLDDRHIEMNKAICRVLKHLGYGKAVNLFCKLDKWYG